jgi:hypothetical protein
MCRSPVAVSVRLVGGHDSTAGRVEVLYQVSGPGVGVGWGGVGGGAWPAGCGGVRAGCRSSWATALHLSPHNVTPSGRTHTQQMPFVTATPEQGVWGTVCDGAREASLACRMHGHPALLCAWAAQTGVAAAGASQNLHPAGHPAACTPDEWDDREARVVCRMLGLPTANARAYQGGERTDMGPHWGHHLSGGRGSGEWFVEARPGVTNTCGGGRFP